MNNNIVLEAGSDTVSILNPYFSSDAIILFITLSASGAFKKKVSSSS